jgi:hypothetical protein
VNQAANPTNAGGDDPDAPKPTPLPPSYGPDDEYEEADFQAGLKAGLTDQAALAMARGNFRKKAITDENLDKNKTSTDNSKDSDPPAGSDGAKGSSLKVYGPKSKSALKTPQGMTEEQVSNVKSILRRDLSEAGYIGKLIVQGSRAAGTATSDKDYDFALVVSPEEFDRILYTKSKFAKPKLSKGDQEALEHSIYYGRIFSREANMPLTKVKIWQYLGVSKDKIQLSIIKENGRFDNWPQIPMEYEEND